MEFGELQKMEFGELRTDLVKLLSLGVGEDTAKKRINELEQLIRSQARAGAQAGALAATPDIRAEVKSALKPWLITLFIISGVALVTSVATVIYVRRKR